MLYIYIIISYIYVIHILLLYISYICVIYIIIIYMLQWWAVSAGLTEPEIMIIIIIKVYFIVHVFFLNIDMKLLSILCSLHVTLYPFGDAASVLYFELRVFIQSESS